MHQSHLQNGMSEEKDMDRYQKVLLKTSRAYIGFSVQGHLKSSGIYEDEKIILKQDPDITINDYTLYISNISVEAVFAIKGASKIPFTAQADPTYRETRERFYYPIDFDNKIDSIVLVFKNNLADNLIIPVIYQEADKQAYYAKKEQERKDALLASATIKCSTGADLVNIYFQPCNDDYARTEIILYRDEQMLAKYKVDEECFFKAITGLAYGTYKFILKQYDKDNNIILESNPTSFKIESATAHIYGKGFVCN
jgi:hypothetical protein